MTARSPDAYLVSALLHGGVIALALGFTYALREQTREQPKVFELVAGEGDNYAATSAPALGNPGGIKLAPAAPAPPKPVEKTLATDVQRIADKRETRQLTKYRAEQEKLAKEEAANAKRLTKEEFDKQNQGKGAPTLTTAPPKVAKIDSQGLRSGLEQGTGSEAGAGGSALTSGRGSVLDAYFSLLKQRLRDALDKPPGLSDTLVAVAEVRLAADGTLSGGRIKRTSGSAEFDQAVLDAIAKTRMPARPDGRSEILTIPFRMREEDSG